MSRFAEYLNAVFARPEVVIHIGAGRCLDLTLYQSLGAGRIVFIEADAELVADAQQQMDHEANVKIRHYALGIKNATQTLFITNNKDFSSLSKPRTLFEYLPNIRLIKREVVQTLTLEQVCINENVDEKTANLLVVEIQDAEKEIFPLLEAKTLKPFKWVVIQTSKENLYEGRGDARLHDVLQVMRESYFTVLCFLKDGPLNTTILCVRDDAAIINKVNEKRRKELLNKFGQQEEALKKALLEEANNLRGVVAIERDETTDEGILTLSTKVAKFKHKRKKAKQKIDSLQIQIEQQQEEITSLLSSKQSVNDALEKSQQTAESWKECADGRLLEVNSLRNHVRVSSKLVLKSENDSEELRTQYQEVMKQRQTQQLLLEKLHEKLQQAVNYYQYLEVTAPAENPAVCEIEDSNGSSDNDI